MGRESWSGDSGSTQSPGAYERRLVCHPDRGALGMAATTHSLAWPQRAVPFSSPSRGTTGACSVWVAWPHGCGCKQAPVGLWGFISLVRLSRILERSMGKPQEEMMDFLPLVT